MKDGVILVGGFPKPVGGVTTFIRRLAASDKRVEEVVDMFSGKEKEIPGSYSGKYHALHNKWRGFVYLFFKMMVWRNKYVHFNFSNLRSLLFFVFLPKRSTKWILMLHHGVLESHLPNFLVRHLLRRFDHIVCMNEVQHEYYRRHGLNGSKVVTASSYIQPLKSKPDKAFQQDVDSYFSDKPTFVASGYPTKIYNLDWCIRFVRGREEYQLALFLYGDGSERTKIQKQQGEFKNIRVYSDQKEENFNYALSKAKCYLRPNMRDSFGIAVADAVNYGVPVLASDICPRQQGAETFRATTYQSFERALVDSLNHKARNTDSASAPIVEFSYDLIA
ncbi:MAG: glycosyltransferase [Candidatus Acidiferrales bacterium]